jgi:hypothetical protein
MIAEMPPGRVLTIALLAMLVGGCGGTQSSDANEPTTAREKQYREAEKTGEVDKTGNWGGWRYQGDRQDCFFVLGRRCFKTQEAACKAAKCAASTKCSVDGGGPATVACK